MIKVINAATESVGQRMAAYRRAMSPFAPAQKPTQSFTQKGRGMDADSRARHYDAWLINCHCEGRQ